ncbi:hypothetical protein CA85_16520 [Allorhodopirellula solitaria]|uniref:Uncharacterized protein n=1 Tax=Allorhodopirellula solitaria TaxID=2527987 RepID=A0A5C5YFR1_9BACT|nr:hypothetical protein CA85_16520 [Allorhodopirellula solitaria]
MASIADRRPTAPPVASVQPMCASHEAHLSHHQPGALKSIQRLRAARETNGASTRFHPASEPTNQPSRTADLTRSGLPHTSRAKRTSTMTDRQSGRTTIEPTKHKSIVDRRLCPSRAFSRGALRTRRTSLITSQAPSKASNACDLPEKQIEHPLDFTRQANRQISHPELPI